MGPQEPASFTGEPRPRATDPRDEDAETVDAALDLVVFRDEVTKGVRRIAGSQSLRDIYGEDGHGVDPGEAPALAE